MNLKRMVNQLGLSLFLLSSSSAFSSQGGSGISGGGDRFVQDFIRVAQMELLPWFKRYGSSLMPAVSAAEFKRSIDNLIEDKTIFSEEVVYESCDGSTKGRRVEVCYSEPGKKLIVSRSSYPVDLRNSISKRRLVAHEIFRMMKLESNDYRVSNQLLFDDIESHLDQDQVKAKCFLSYTDKEGLVKNYILSTHGISDGLQTTFPDGTISSKLVIAPEFLAEILVYQSNLKLLPKIYLTGYDAHFQMSSLINGKGKNSVELARNDNEQDRSLHADCEIFN